jgi:hypothetical protein
LRTAAATAPSSLTSHTTAERRDPRWTTMDALQSGGWAVGSGQAPQLNRQRSLADRSGTAPGPLVPDLSV